MADDSDTYDPSNEFVDNSAIQGTLGTEDPTQHRESRVEQGGSDEFADDRVDDDGDEGSQANLTPETVDDGGQMDLTGDTATDDPDWQDEQDGEGANDTDPYDALNEWGPTSTRPVSDVDDDLEHPLADALNDDAIISPGGRYRADESEGYTAAEEARTAGADPAEVYDPTNNLEPDSDESGADLPNSLDAYGLTLTQPQTYRDESSLNRGAWSLTYDDSRGGKAMITHDIGGPDSVVEGGANEALNEDIGDVGEAREWFVNWLRDELEKPGDVLNGDEDNEDDSGGEWFVRADEGAHAYLEGPFDTEEAATEHRVEMGDVGEYWVVEDRPDEDADEGGESDADTGAWTPTSAGYGVVPGANSAQVKVEQETHPDGSNKPGNWTVTLVDPSGRDEYVVGEHLAGSKADTVANRIASNVSPATIGHGGDRLVDAVAGALDVDPAEIFGPRDELNPGDGGEHAGDEDDDANDPEVGEKVEFGTLDEANNWRDDHPDALHTTDTRRTKTITLRADTSDKMLDDVGKAAQVSRGDESKTYDTTKLSEAERDRLDSNYRIWHWNKYGFEAMRAKTALLENGVPSGDWLNYYEPGEGAEGALSNLEAGKAAAGQGQGSTATVGHRLDVDDDPGEVGRRIEEAEAEMCDSAEDACEDNEPKACEALRTDCGWSDDEVQELKKDTAELVGEDPGEVYDPSVDEGTGESFGDWARANEPADADPEIPEKPDPITPPSDEELAQIAPTSPGADVEGEMTGSAYRAISKAWSGYKLARVEAREAHGEADRYAAVINGIRAVNGQEPLDFQEIEEWAGGEVMPDDPTEEYPAPEGTEETLAEAQQHGHAAGVVQQTLDSIGGAAGSDPYDPTEDL